MTKPMISAHRDHSRNCVKHHKPGSRVGTISRCEHGKILQATGVNRTHLPNWKTLSPWTTPIAYWRATEILLQLDIAEQKRQLATSGKVQITTVEVPAGTTMAETLQDARDFDARMKGKLDRFTSRF
jgi:hypothetical protein